MKHSKWEESKKKEESVSDYVAEYGWLDETKLGNPMSVIGG